MLPERLGLDTNVLVTLLIQPKVVSAEQLRVRAFFATMRTQQAVGAITSTTLHEFVHAAIRASYLADLSSHSSAIGGKRSWELLYKARPDLLRSYEARLRQLVATFPRLGIAVPQPNDLAPLPAGRRIEDLLIETVVQHQLLSNDAAILVELRRAGITSIASEDLDLRRGAPDFDVYTWL